MDTAPLHKLFTRKMTRKEFLIFAGTTFLTIAGIDAIFSSTALAQQQPSGQPNPSGGSPNPSGATSTTDACAGSGGGSGTVGPEGIEYPPNLQEHPSQKGYFLMPDPTDGSYAFEKPECKNHHYGSKLLLGVLYTVAKRWKQKHPQGRLNIGDLNAAGHKSHKWGRAVDLDATTDGKDWVAEKTRGNYNRAASIELGKMFIDTGAFLHIWYNDQEVCSAVIDYGKQTGKWKPDMQMMYQVNHDNHFHLDVRLEPKLSQWEPGC